MGLSVGIVGLPNVGKSTLFNALLKKQHRMYRPRQIVTEACGKTILAGEHIVVLSYIKENMNIKLISTISVVLLLLAIPSNIFPYGYYIFLRWVITLSSLYVAYCYHNLKNETWTIVFGIVAILFNPIAPIYLDRSIWIIIDFVTLGLFVFTILKTRTNLK